MSTTTTTASTRHEQHLRHYAYLAEVATSIEMANLLEEMAGAPSEWAIAYENTLEASEGWTYAYEVDAADGEAGLTLEDLLELAGDDEERLAEIAEL
jgi:hypothetical protein